LSDVELFEEGVKLMRWFAKPFAETRFTKIRTREGDEVKKAAGRKRTLKRCKGDMPAKGEGDDPDDPDSGNARRRRTTGTIDTDSTRKKKRLDGGGVQGGGKRSGRTEYKNVDSIHLQVRNMTQGADVTKSQPTLMTLPWSVMEKIYTAKEGEFSVRDIPSRDELDRHLRRFVKERHQAPDIYQLYTLCQIGGEQNYEPTRERGG
jgi:hypothetical protein